MVGRRHSWWWATLFLLPAAMLTLVFFYYPMGYIIWLSVHQWNGLSTIKPFTGFKEYSHLLQEPIFNQVMRNTIVFVVGTVIPSIAIGLGLALLLNRPLPFRTLVRGLSFAPYLVSFVSAGLAWVWMGSSNGLFNHLLGLFGLHPGNLVANPTFAMPYVIAMYTWKMSGYNMVLYLAGLQTIPREIYEAGAIDGLKPGWTQFRAITWPLLRETTFFVLIINLIFSFRAFSAVYVMTGGGPIHATTTLVYYIWRLAFIHNSWGQAAAASTALLAAVLLLTVGMVRYFTRDPVHH